MYQDHAVNKHRCQNSVHSYVLKAADFSLNKSVPPIQVYDLLLP